ALRPDDPQLYYFRGMVHFRQQRHTEALRDFDTAVTRDPNFALAYFYRGRMRVTLAEEWAEAEKDFSKALELDPKPTQTRSWRAIARAKTGRPAEASADAKQCVSEDPDEPLTSFYAARALAQCSKVARTPGEATQYGNLCIDLLRRAITLGFRDSDRL